MKLIIKKTEFYRVRNNGPTMTQKGKKKKNLWVFYILSDYPKLFMNCQEFSHYYFMTRFQIH